MSSYEDGPRRPEVTMRSTHARKHTDDTVIITESVYTRRYADGNTATRVVYYVPDAFGVCKDDMDERSVELMYPHVIRKWVDEASSDFEDK